MESQLTTHNRRVETEVLARQGLRLPPITLKCLRTAGIYCQPSVSIEHQHLAKKYSARAATAAPPAKKLPESGAGAVPADKHPGFKKRLGEVLGICLELFSVRSYSSAKRALLSPTHTSTMAS
jgi:hypothetical protein